ncbi:hypothetical protein [Labrenzia sp. 011]|uniref:hypothetical protein n=1 Tax=Labrenzia sp. 011 TaxID=2171494 RepID=UPI000D521EFD|nr:hypothetical protein [Labrenzia sp. 011]PVB59315.1 hypothetical protein DCO57_22745 [Labrenzia sp. 011]
MSDGEFDRGEAGGNPQAEGLQGMDTPAGAFLSTLSDNDRALATENGWQDIGSVLESYRTLREQLSGAVTLPEKSASEEDRAAFYAELSKTWTPEDGYQFRMPEALPENFPYDQAFAKEAEGWFQEAGLHPAAAQKLHDRWVGKMADQFTAHEQASRDAARQQAEAVEAAHRALVKEYGEPGSDGYQNVVAKAERALSGLKNAGVDLGDWFSGKGALTQPDENGLQQVADPAAVKLLAFVHDKAFAEDGLAVSGTEGGGANPFDRDRPNLKEQSDLLERNPARARQLILAAGRDPRKFML